MALSASLSVPECEGNSFPLGRFLMAKPLPRFLAFHRFDLFPTIRAMFGSVLNALGILVGATVGLSRGKPLSRTNESFFQVMLGVFSVFYGLRLTWLSLNGTFPQILKQLLITVVALMIGKLLGHFMRIQSLSNSLGRDARRRIEAAGSAGSRPKVSEGFSACAALFCAGPLGIVGALQDGLSGYFYPLAIKAIMDGLAAMAFVSFFGWSVMLAALPVLAFQGTIALASTQYLAPFLTAHGLLDSVNATGGLLVFSVALVILGLKRIELADYLPSLAIAPLLTWVFK
jgi:uncharacterized membrane protein YqgA involved in biofilm formation